MKTYYLMILTALILTGCGCGDVVVSPKQQPLTSNLVMTIQNHGNSSYYVPMLSDTPYYLAINVTNTSATDTTLKSVNITNQVSSVFGQSVPDEFTLVTKDASNYYPSGQTVCNNGISLTSGASCEVLVKLANPNQPNLATATLTIIADDNQSYAKTVVKHPYAYIAGNFTSTYNTNPVIHQTQMAGAYCGPNQDSLCAILEYDIENNTVTNLGGTDYYVNSIVPDSNGVLYLGGGFDMGYAYNGESYVNPVIGPVTSPTATMVLSLNPVLANQPIVSDFVKDVTPVGESINYPDEDIHTMAVNRDQLYVAGGFQAIGNLKSNNYPLVAYNFTNQSWNFVFGTDDTQNPNDAISAINFDSQNNLYLSGYYSSVSGFSNTQPLNIFSINKCQESSGVYLCNNNSDNVVYIDSTVSQQPAFTINFDSGYNLYLAGGFSGIGNVGSAGTFDYLIVKLTPLPTFENIASVYTLPDQLIGMIVPFYSAGGFYASGEFTSVGTIASDNNFGTCGINHTQSCLLAQYDGTNWQKVFTADDIINTFTISAKISGD